MAASEPPGAALARRLRELRESHFPHARLTQPDVARALGGISVPLVSSWESPHRSVVPKDAYLVEYATVFCTPRSFQDGQLRRLRDQDLTADETAAREALLRELRILAGSAIPMVVPSGPIRGSWDFTNDDGEIIIVCARLPAEMLARMPYTDPDDPDYVRLYSFADLDALMELRGHLRAANPYKSVRFFTPTEVRSHHLSGHLVLLGGVDWNTTLRSLAQRLKLRVRQQSRPDDDPYGSSFQVVNEKGAVEDEFWPQLDREGSRITLREDIAYFFRGYNPYNTARTVTICNGMFARGTYGAVRALTDTAFRDRNEAYVKARFGEAEAYSILTKVEIANGETVTPDWNVDENRLHEWSRPA